MSDEEILSTALNMMLEEETLKYQNNLVYNLSKDEFKELVSKNDYDTAYKLIADKIKGDLVVEEVAIEKQLQPYKDALRHIANRNIIRATLWYKTKN